MSRLLKILFSVPRTIWFNLRYLPLSQAVRLPIWLASNVRIKQMYRGGFVVKGTCKPGLIRLGYHEADAVDTYGTHTILSVAKNGQLFFEEDAHIGHGAIINVKNGGKLCCGRNFAISGTTSIICNKLIKFGDDVQLSWNSLITDGDAHKIFSDDGVWINPNEEIIVGNKVWIAANNTILKGTFVSDNTVIASNSLVNKKFNQGDCIIGGTPAKMLKSIGYFEI